MFTAFVLVHFLCRTRMCAWCRWRQRESHQHNCCKSEPLASTSVAGLCWWPSAAWIWKDLCLVQLCHCRCLNGREDGVHCEHYHRPGPCTPSAICGHRDASKSVRGLALASEVSWMNLNSFAIFNCVRCIFIWHAALFCLVDSSTTPFGRHEKKEQDDDEGDGDAGSVQDFGLGDVGDEEDDDKNKTDSAEAVLHEFVYKLKSHFMETERNLRVPWHTL